MEIINDPGVYIKGLLADIDRIKARGGHVVYRINDKITKKVATGVKVYFNKLAGYSVSMTKCAVCLNEYDVIITFY